MDQDSRLSTFMGRRYWLLKGKEQMESNEEWAWQMYNLQQSMEKHRYKVKWKCSRRATGRLRGMDRKWSLLLRSMTDV